MFSKSLVVLLTGVIIAGTWGCAALVGPAPQLEIAKGELELIDRSGRITAPNSIPFDPDDRLIRPSGQAIDYIFTLSEERTIRQIKIYPEGPVKDLEVSIRSSSGSWNRVTEIKGRQDSSITVPARLRGDAVRVRQRTLVVPQQINEVRIRSRSSGATGGLFKRSNESSKPGYVRDIEVFVVPGN